MSETNRLTGKQHLFAIGIVAVLTLIWAITESTYYSADTFFVESPDIDTWGASFLCSIAIWCPWIVLTPAILLVCKRFPFKKERLGKAITVHLLACAVFGTLKTLMESLLLISMFDGPFKILGPGLVSYACFIYWFFPAVYNGIIYFQRYHEREIKVSRLETQLAHAKLEALKKPLRPHFLFNTLNAISTLARFDAKTAERMINGLSDLLRLSLENIDRQEVPLHEEIDFLERYLDIERVRFGDQLEMQIEIDEDARDARVPNLLLQPIVENAINHGIDPAKAKGLITLRAFKQNSDLRIDVIDNGCGPPDGDIMELSGIGLRNTRARLEQLYGAEGKIAFHVQNGGGLRVSITQPFRKEAENVGRTDRETRQGARS